MDFLSSRFDISKTLMSNERSPRNEFAFIQSSATEKFGKIHALRMNDYKAHFFTEGNIYSTNEDLSCIGIRKVNKIHLASSINYLNKEHDPPLLYNVAHDPGERYTQGPDNNEEYEEVMAELLARREILESELVWAESRLGQLSVEAIPCCNRPCAPFPSCCACRE